MDKLSVCDKLQGLLRIKAFLDDISEIQKHINHKYQEKMVKQKKPLTEEQKQYLKTVGKLRERFYSKYGIPYGIAENHAAILRDKAKENYAEKYYGDKAICVIEPYEGIKALPTEGVHRDESCQSLRDGRYLLLSIDMKSKSRDILRELKEIVTSIKEHETLRTKHRKKESVKDIWKVYDLKKSGKNPCKIAEELSGKKGNPNYDSTLRAYYDMVRRAIKKAENIIKDIERDIMVVE